MSSHVVEEKEKSSVPSSPSPSQSTVLPPGVASSPSPSQSTVLPPGVAHIKTQYVLQKRPLQKDSHKNDQSPSQATPNPSLTPPPKRRKVRGQNKNRPSIKLNFSDQLCPSLHNSFSSSTHECSYKEKCRYSHNVTDFLLSKLPDINDTCYMYINYGYCPSGVACRYGRGHISSEGQNIVNSALYDENRVRVFNVLSKNLQINLRKKKVKFIRTETFLKNDKEKDVAISKEGVVTNEEGVVTNEEGVVTNEEGVVAVKESDETIKDIYKENNKASNEEGVAMNISKEDVAIDDKKEGVVMDNNNKEGVVIESTSNDTSVGPFTDEDKIKLRLLEKKKIDFRNKLYLAPLTTVGNLPFRRICKKFGVDITCGEMALAVKLLQGQQSEWALMKRHECEDIFGVQVCGSFQDSMTKCAEMINTNCNVDFIDINVGCPLDMVYKKGGGCGLMQRKGRFEQIVRGMSSVIDIPLTVKMRTGVYDKNWNAHKLAPCVREWGASLLSIHGRSREQRYTNLADWNYINECAQLADPMPVFGNGDILSFEDYQKALDGNSISGVMIARGALIKPWIFTEIKEQRHWDISSSERFQILRDYTNYGLENWGSDTLGVERTRRFLLEWLSFLHRYIPVGLLERLPQKINERPPLFYGRDDLETMMASRNCQDWIKISEMLLGPVPDNFSFLPKHKANSYTATDEG